MPERIFISSRRDDARGASGRVYDWLRIAFGREKVFRDVASIGPGKWRERIDAALADSIVCLPVIGPRWCDTTNRPRLAEEGDMVRHELLTALARSADGLSLIPTLVEGARVPARDCLPPELRDLLEWNAYPLSDEGWEDDMRRLLDAVSRCAGQSVAGDVDSLLQRAAEAEARMHSMEHEKHLQAEQIRALTDTIAALTRQMAERLPSDRADLAAALADLGRGDTTAAEAAFQRVLDQRGDDAEQAAHEAAEAARNIANLALLGDIEKAIRYYRRACQLEAGHAETWGLLGHACLSAGDTGAAREALTRARLEARQVGDSWGEFGRLAALDKVERRGLAILRALQVAGRLLPSQDWTSWFEGALQAIEDGGRHPDEPQTLQS
jgi:tetratricopeptide (TPR) repeat protein